MQFLRCYDVGSLTVVSCSIRAFVQSHRVSTRWSYDGHTVDEKDTRSLHEDAPSGRPSAIFWHAKDFVNTPEDAAGSQKLSRRSHDGLGCSPEWPDVFTIIPDVANLLHRVSIASQYRSRMKGGNDVLKNFFRFPLDVMQNSVVSTQNPAKTYRPGLKECASHKIQQYCDQNW